MELTVDQALQKGVEAHKAGNYQEADKLYTAILQAQPKHPDANHNMGVLAVGVNKVQESLTFFKVALEANPSIGQFWLSYIDALMKVDRLADAKAVFNEAKNKGANGDSFDQLEQRLSELSSNLQDPPSIQLQPIINLYTQGHLQRALSDTTEMLERFPNSVVLYNIAGASNAGLMKFDASIESYQQALRIKPDYAEAYNNMGNTLKAAGNLEASIDNYNKAIDIKSDYAEAYYNMGIALNDRGDLEAAIESYKQAIKNNPDYAEAYNNMGVTLNDKGDSELAMDSYKLAIKIKSDYVDAHNNMGNALQSQGDAEAAADSYKKALKTDPDSAKTNYSLGLVLLEAKKYAKAAEYFKFSDFENSKYYLLRCLYLQDKKTLFYDQLDNLINQGEIHSVIGSLGCRSALRYGVDRPNLFCKDPLNYVVNAELSHQYDFIKIFVKTAKTILNENRIPIRMQGLLNNGYQTSGNLFSLESDLTKNIQKIIRLEIKKYQVIFKDSEEGIITNWPTNYSLNGWLVCMKSGGELRPHMHENGWISGSIYINVPPKTKTKSGNLVVCIEEQGLVNDNTIHEKSIDVVTGSLCLFPASLLHYTIPFESEEDRIVLAFDVVPKH